MTLLTIVCGIPASKKIVLNSVSRPWRNGEIFFFENYTKMFVKSFSKIQYGNPNVCSLPRFFVDSVVRTDKGNA